MNEASVNILQSEFNLSKKDTQIILFLSKKKMTAEALCGVIKIPKGKIYTFLNKLLEMNLIEKSSDFPALYSAPNLEHKMLNFLNEEFERFTKKQAKLVSLISKQTIDAHDFEIIYSKKEFIFRLMEFLAEGDEFKYILRYPALPYLAYVSNSKEFLETLNMISESRDALTDTKDNLPVLLNNFYHKKFKEGSRFDYILCRSALEEFLKLIENNKGKSARRKKVLELKKKMKKYNVSMRVVDEHFPLGVYLSKNKVIIILTSSGALTGIIHKKREVIKFYENLFNEMNDRSYPIEDCFMTKKDGAKK